MARHGALQTTGSYGSGANCGRSLSGVYIQPMGTTMRVASSLLHGHTFQDSRTPSLSSISSNELLICKLKKMSILQTVQTARSTYGCDHGDYARYRKYCVGKIASASKQNMLVAALFRTERLWVSPIFC